MRAPHFNVMLLTLFAIEADEPVGPLVRGTGQSHLIDGHTAGPKNSDRGSREREIRDRREDSGSHKGARDRRKRRQGYRQEVIGSSPASAELFLGAVAVSPGFDALRPRARLGVNQ